jgi:hypothetical protein
MAYWRTGVLAYWHNGILTLKTCKSKISVSKFPADMLPTYPYVTCRRDIVSTSVDTVFGRVANMLADMLATCRANTHVSVNLTIFLTFKNLTFPAKIFIPGPFLQDAIITLNSNDPFDLIPLMNSRARDFEAEVADILAEMNGSPVNHVDILNAWLYGVKQGTIPETRYSVLPDNNKIAQINFQRHQACILQGGFQQIAGVTWATNNQAANVDNHASVLQQFTAAISAQNKEAIESNNLHQNEILRQVS